MLNKVTRAHYDIINNSKPTYDWEDEATGGAARDADDLRARFEQLFTDFTHSHDLGRIIVYFKDHELAAFYDYERFQGTVF
jgi:hypothetical protein